MKKGKKYNKTLYKNCQHYDIKFSVIMPTYNREKIIGAAILSVLNQSYQSFELIIIDDGSTDNTDEYINTHFNNYIKSGKIKYIKSVNGGVCSARNKGLALAKYDWIAYVDSDNTIEPFFLETFAEAIKSNPDYKCFYARSRFISSGKESEYRKFSYNDLIKRNYIDLGVYVHHKDLIKEIGMFDTNLKRLVDWDLIIRFSQKYTPLPIDKVVLNYNDDATLDRITTTGNISYAVAHNEIMKKYGDNFTVATVIISYNHEDYIGQAIESALMQRGNFIHEIYIADDASNDSTPQIIKEYAEKYPTIIRNISVEKNLGISKNYERVFNLIQAKYIAVLEGDDFWLQSSKLAKQVNLLESMPKLKMAFSSVKIFNNKTKKFTRNTNPNLKKSVLTYKDFLSDDKQNLIVNFSCCVFKKDELIHLPAKIWEDRLSEISLAFYFTKHGKVGYISEPLSAYRVQEGGAWSGLDDLGKVLSGYRCRKTALYIANNASKVELYKVLKIKYIPQLLKENMITSKEVNKLKFYMSAVKTERVITVIPRSIGNFFYLIYKVFKSLKTNGVQETNKKIICRLFGNIFNYSCCKSKCGCKQKK